MPSSAKLASSTAAAMPRRGAVWRRFMPERERFRVQRRRKTPGCALSKGVFRENFIGTLSAKARERFRDKGTICSGLGLWLKYLIHWS
jgi:hypothetical protein